MRYNVDGKLMELVNCEKCGAMKVEGKQCACEKLKDIIPVKAGEREVRNEK